MGEVEQAAQLFAGLVFEGRRLNGRWRAGLAVAWLVASLHAGGVDVFVHGINSFAHLRGMCDAATNMATLALRGHSAVFQRKRRIVQRIDKLR